MRLQSFTYEIAIIYICSRSRLGCRLPSRALPPSGSTSVPPYSTHAPAPHSRLALIHRPAPPACPPSSTRSHPPTHLPQETPLCCTSPSHSSKPLTPSHTYCPHGRGTSRCAVRASARAECRTPKAECRGALRWEGNVAVLCHPSRCCPNLHMRL